ncbi:MAG: energy transducer TonB [Thermoanaerobaculia bacterium]|nr:energy transducer TonB [Thermoanaerobaculia bacterium]
MLLTMKRALWLPGFVVMAACWSPPPPPPEAPPLPPPPPAPAAAVLPLAEAEPPREILRAGDGVDGPVVLTRVEPNFEHIALTVDEEPRGVVIAELVVDEWGAVESARVLKSSDVASVDEAVLAAVGEWTFEPARAKGKPVAAYFVVTVNVDLR